MISIDFNSKAALKEIKGVEHKVQYAVGYTIDHTARDVIRYNKNYILPTNFDFTKKNFLSFVGRAMWQYPRGAARIRNNRQETNLFFHNKKIDDYFSLHEEGGPKTRRVVPFGSTKRRQIKNKKKYAEYTGQDYKRPLKFSAGILNKSPRIVKTGGGIFARRGSNLDPLFTFQNIVYYKKTYNFEKLSTIHGLKQINKHFPYYIGKIQRG